MPPAIYHVLGGFARAEEDAAQVDGDDLVEIVNRHFSHNLRSLCLGCPFHPPPTHTFRLRFISARKFPARRRAAESRLNGAHVRWIDFVLRARRS